MSTISASDHLRPRPHVVAARHVDGTVLMDVEAGAYYTLNDAGGRIWELVSAGESLAAIIDQLCREYDAPLERIRRDALALIDRFIAARLIEPAPPGSMKRVTTEVRHGA